jgi:hypothetical protein
MYKKTYPHKEERKKNLKTLIDDISQHNEELYQSMDSVRKTGNQIIHPKKTKMSKAILFERREFEKIVSKT